MEFTLLPLKAEEWTAFKRDAQEAFQNGFEEVYGTTEEIILPEKDIDQSLHAKGSAAYQAVCNGEIAGGAVVVLDEETRRGHLDLLFVKAGAQSRGIGKQIWFALEQRYPDLAVWETCSPYFERRNIHFYVNVCGFHITEFFHETHPMPDMPEAFIGDGNEGMFRFEKHMQTDTRRQSNETNDS